jgi:hypothetical protein
MFVPTIAQQLDTTVYNHIGSLLHVSSFFGHLHGGNRQRKRQHSLCNGYAIVELKILQLHIRDIISQRCAFFVK